MAYVRIFCSKLWYRWLIFRLIPRVDRRFIYNVVWQRLNCRTRSLRCQDSKGMAGWAHGVLQGVKVGRTDSVKKTGWGLGLLLDWPKPLAGVASLTAASASLGWTRVIAGASRSQYACPQL